MHVRHSIYDAKVWIVYGDILTMLIKTAIPRYSPKLWYLQPAQTVGDLQPTLNTIFDKSITEHHLPCHFNNVSISRCCSTTSPDYS